MDRNHKEHRIPGGGNFTTNRMMSDYIEKYYIPLAQRYGKMIASDFAKARKWHSEKASPQGMASS